MFCKNRITLVGFLGKDAETRFTAKGAAHTRFSLATNVSWKDKDSGEYKTRTEWHRVVVWRKFGEWAGSLRKGAYIEVEGELRYREFQPNGSDAKVRTAEIHAVSILTFYFNREEKPVRGSEAAGLVPCLSRANNQWSSLVGFFVAWHTCH